MFSAGEAVQQAIDNEEHDQNCRLHTAVHIVGLAVRSSRAVNPDVTEPKAQHYPNAAFIKVREFNNTT